MDVAEWKACGSTYRLQGRNLFVVDTGRGQEIEGKPTLVILHGYPTSSHDYHRVLPQLCQHYRVIVHDHLGFGLSDKPTDYSYSCLEQTDFAVMLWRHLGVKQAHVFAHDYGTTMATELVARWGFGLRPIALRSVTLCNGSVHIELARLRPIQRVLLNAVVGPLLVRIIPQSTFNRNMRALWHDPSRLSDADLDAMWELLNRDQGRMRIPELTQYLRQRRHYWHRWVGALRHTELPLRFLWGAQDPITGRVVANAHHDEAPGSRLTLLEDVGHYPMLEAPQRWAHGLLELLAAG